MTSSSVSVDDLKGLPDALMVAQRAIALPEVQAMMARLAEFNLGIYMPHMHDLETGAFEVMPLHMTQVEDGLKVAFETIEATESDDRTFVDTAWVWQDGPNARAICKNRCVKQGSEHTTGS